MAKQKNNATATVKGIIYQFLVALKKCFELQEGESVYIETFGDVSAFGKDAEQIETKFYKKDLTDMDINVWKTLSNWFDDRFDLNSFNSLILLTTQKIKPTSKWFDWNNKSISDRLRTITEIKDDFLKKQKKSRELSAIIDKLFDNSKNGRLKLVLEKFYIDHSAPDDEKFYKAIRDEYAKVVPKTRRDRFIHSMFGFMVSPATINNNNWQIQESLFSKEVEELAKTLQDTTAVFPEKIHLKDIKTEEYNEHLFVNKIQQIQYKSVIPEAVTDYAQTQQMIIQELIKLPTISKSFENYDEEIYNNYQKRYQNECIDLNEKDDAIKKSKVFYNNSMLADSDKKFHTYSSIPDYFKRGVLHIRANDENSNLKWLLEYEKDS